MRQVTKLPVLPARPKDAHKGTFGKVLVIAGSRGMTGAAALCTQAVLAGGAGLVRAALPQEAYPITAQLAPCAIFHPLHQTDDGTLAADSRNTLERLIQNHDIIAIGPGLGQHEETRHVILWLIANIEKPIVIDADAISAVSTDLSCLERSRGPRILTPHPGEMARLLGLTADEVQQNRAKIAADFAAKYSACVVLKGRNTVVTNGDAVYLNTSGNPGMATAGCGDVLTGLVAAFWAQRINAFGSAQLAVYLHGLAGDIAAKDLSEYCVTARDVLERLPAAFLRWQSITSGVTL